MMLRWPLDNAYREITSYYGVPSIFGPHAGIDISVISGNRVYAAHAGSVRYDPTLGGGMCIKLLGDGMVTRYCHLSRYVVAENTWVNQGDVIAISGNTGVSTGAHLHFELYLLGERVDPLLYLEKEDPPVKRKVAAHFQNMTSWAAGVIGTYWTLPMWVKVMNPPVPDAFPNTRILGRAWIHDDNNSWEGHLVAKGSAGGVEYFNAMYDYYNRRRGIVTAWEGPNEPNLTSPDMAAKYRDFLIAWNDKMQSAQLKTCGGSIAVGNPKVLKYDGTNEEWRIVAPALARCNYWSYHGYWQRPYDPVDDWWCHRYRLLVKEAADFGVTLPRLIISETGVDNHGGINDGWRSQYNNDWGAFFADVQRYSDELDKDTYVEASTFFTMGANSDWFSFEFDQLQTIDLGKYAAGLGAPAQPAEGLPEHETSQDPALIAEKIRWWLEEMERQYQSGNTGYAQRIRLSLIQLGYRLERILKDA